MEKINSQTALLLIYLQVTKELGFETKLTVQEY
jgi:hypothetical protein